MIEPRREDQVVTVKTATLPALPVEASAKARPVRYREVGAGRPIVLLHAFPLSGDQWLPHMRVVPPGVRFVAPDFRGFRSPDGPAAAGTLERVTMDDYARDVWALLDELGIERAGVAGMSMGGYVAFAMLRQAPARVSALYLINTRATPDTPAQRDGRDRMIALVREQGPAAVADDMLPKLLGPTAMTAQPDVVTTVRRLIEVNSAEAIAAALQALKARPDSTPLLSAIRCPTTIVHGEEDAIITRDEAEVMNRAIENSRLVVLPDVGHIPMGPEALVTTWISR